MKLKKTSFWKAKELISENKKKSLYILCLDALFFFVMFILSKIVSPDPYAKYDIHISLSLLFIVVYFAFILLFYSLMKYILLLLIKSMNKKAEFSLKNYFRFVLLNIIIALIIFFILAIISIIVNATVKQENLAIMSIIVMSLVGFVFYFYANIVHMLFIITNKIRKNVKEAFAILLKDGSVYSPLLINILIFVVIYIIFGFVFTLIVGIENISIYKQVFAVLAGILFYVLIFFNRIHLFCKIGCRRNA